MARQLSRIRIPGCNAITLDGEEFKADRDGVFEIPDLHVAHVRESYGGVDAPEKAKKYEGTKE